MCHSVATKDATGHEYGPAFLLELANFQFCMLNMLHSNANQNHQRMPRHARSGPTPYCHIDRVSMVVSQHGQYRPWHTTPSITSTFFLCLTVLLHRFAQLQNIFGGPMLARGGGGCTHPIHLDLTTDHIYMSLLRAHSCGPWLSLCYDAATLPTLEPSATKQTIHGIVGIIDLISGER